MSSGSRPGKAAKRLMKELQDYQQSPNPRLLHFEPVSDAELTHWQAVMTGPQGTPFESGVWKLDIQIPESYPNSPPEVKFVTPCCHPNVNFETGAICLDLFNKGWTPAYQLNSVMDAVYHLLSYPAPDNPYNVDVAKLYRDGDLIGAESLIRYFCEEYRYNGR